MKVLAYFGLTIVSIFIQFCVIDYIQPYEEQLDLSATSQKIITYDILKNISYKPHALYYQTNQKSPKEIITQKRPNIYTNLTLPETIFGTSTELTSTIVDTFYDENMTSTNFGLVTTESFVITTELDNVTEITLFEKNNKTSFQTAVKPRKNVTYGMNYECSCNLQFQVCDVNCCCDEDCLETEKSIFNCVKETIKPAIMELCYMQNPLKFENKESDNFVDNLFCIAKTNLPEHRDIHDSKVDVNIVNKVYKWKDRQREVPSFNFTKRFYKAGDPLWIYENGSLSYLELPLKTFNIFCAKRIPLRFLHENQIKCNIKLGDLEMLEAYRISQESKLVSALEHTINSTTLNCSTLHCINWTVIMCDIDDCVDFNKTLHEPHCSARDCKNIAWKVEYIFYYHKNKFINATIKFHVDSPYNNGVMEYISQEVSVKFILTNESEDNIVSLSGSPGYIPGLPVIVSYTKSNHTVQFFNTTNHNKYIPFLKNVNGACVSSKTAKDYVSFGVNERHRCRYTYTSPTSNERNICEKIQNKINNLLGVDRNVTVSPLGNPFGIKDKDWKLFYTNSTKELPPVYSKIFANKSKLQCYNLITRVAYVFIYADVSENDKRENKILAAVLERTPQNKTFNIEDIRVVLTVDTSFIDDTKPPVTEFASAPSLNIHLPKDFFFPFPSNNCCKNTTNVLILGLLSIMFAMNK